MQHRAAIDDDAAGAGNSLQALQPNCRFGNSSAGAGAEEQVRNMVAALGDGLHRASLIVDGLEDVARVLNMRRVPRRIEGYDISHIQGCGAVAAVSVLIDGTPAPHLYRWCRVSSDRVRPGHSDDYAALAEVIRRRFSGGVGALAGRGREEVEGRGDGVGSGYAEQDAGGGPGEVQPDLVLIDGGKGQLAAVMDAVAAAGLRRRGSAAQTQFVALAKQREELYVPDAPQPVRVDGGMCGAGMLLLRRCRDEAHAFAVFNHRRTRSLDYLRSIFDQVPGGVPLPARLALIKAFPSASHLRNATQQAFSRVPGVSPDIAAALSRHFSGDDMSVISHPNDGSSASQATTNMALNKEVATSHDANANICAAAAITNIALNKQVATSSADLSGAGGVPGDMQDGGVTGEVAAEQGETVGEKGKVATGEGLHGWRDALRPHPVLALLREGQVESSEHLLKGRRFRLQGRRCQQPDAPPPRTPRAPRYKSAGKRRIPGKGAGGAGGGGVRRMCKSKRRWAGDRAIFLQRTRNPRYPSAVLRAVAAALEPLLALAGFLGCPPRAASGCVNGSNARELEAAGPVEHRYPPQVRPLPPRLCLGFTPFPSMVLP